MHIRRNGKLTRVNQCKKEDVKELIKELSQSNISKQSKCKLIKILRDDTKFEPYIGDDTRKRIYDPKRPRTPYSRRRKTTQLKQDN